MLNRVFLCMKPKILLYNYIIGCYNILLELVKKTSMTFDKFDSLSRWNSMIKHNDYINMING